MTIDTIDDIIKARDALAANEVWLVRMSITKRDKAQALGRRRCRKEKRQWREWCRRLVYLARREAERHHDPIGDALNEYEQTRPFKDVVSRRLH